MGAILKTKKMTTFGEAIVLIVGVALVCGIAFFTIPTKSKTATATESCNCDTTAITAATPAPLLVDTTTSAITVVQSTKHDTITQASKAPRHTTISTTPTVVKSTKKADDRENLNLQF